MKNEAERLVEAYKADLAAKVEAANQDIANIEATTKGLTDVIEKAQHHISQIKANPEKTGERLSGGTVVARNAAYHAEMELMHVEDFHDDLINKAEKAAKALKKQTDETTASLDQLMQDLRNGDPAKINRQLSKIRLSMEAQQQQQTGLAELSSDSMQQQHTRAEIALTEIVKHMKKACFNTQEAIHGFTDKDGNVLREDNARNYGMTTAKEMGEKKYFLGAPEKYATALNVGIIERTMTKQDVQDALDARAEIQRELEELRVNRMDVVSELNKIKRSFARSSSAREKSEDEIALIQKCDRLTKRIEILESHKASFEVPFDYQPIDSLDGWHDISKTEADKMPEWFSIGTSRADHKADADTADQTKYIVDMIARRDYARVVHMLGWKAFSYVTASNLAELEDESGRTGGISQFLRSSLDAKQTTYEEGNQAHNITDEILAMTSHMYRAQTMLFGNAWRMRLKRAHMYTYRHRYKGDQAAEMTNANRGEYIMARKYAWGRLRRHLFWGFTEPSRIIYRNFGKKYFGDGINLILGKEPRRAKTVLKTIGFFATAPIALPFVLFTGVSSWIYRAFNRARYGAIYGNRSVLRKIHLADEPTLAKNNFTISTETDPIASLNPAMA